MITLEQIEVALNRLLVEKFPAAKAIYRNRCPRKFERPSFLIETVKSEEGAANQKTVRCVVFMTITAFLPVDDHGNAEDGALISVQGNVMLLFRVGHIKVGDRSIKVKASSGGADFDRSYVDLEFEFFDDRTDETETAPLMAEVDLEFKEESNHGNA